MKFINNLFEKIFHRQELLNLQSENVDFKRRVRELELKVDEKEKLLDDLRKEYKHLKSSAETGVEKRKKEDFEEIFVRLSKPFSQINTMRKMDREGKDIRAKDVLRLISQIEKVFFEKGIIQIGNPGEELPFNSELHQPAGSFSPGEAEEVIVRFCGYKTEERLIKRALVGPKE